MIETIYTIYGQKNVGNFQKIFQRVLEDDCITDGLYNKKIGCRENKSTLIIDEISQIFGYVRG